MAIRNPEWYDLNESRSWPLADQATMLDDSGVRMANNLIVDMNVWFPESVGEYAFLSAVTVGPRIATVTMLSTATGYPPIAAVSLAAPVEPYRPYPVEPLYPGARGWIVFGSGLLEESLRHHRFSTPLQSLLIPHVARKHKDTPIPYVGKTGIRTVLDGIVRLKGGEDVEIVKDVREIEGVVREVIVFQLAASDDAAAESILQRYYGPCGGRPESRTCEGPPPIEVINSVEPDCCGNITVEFRGCADISVVENEPCGVIIDCGFGLGESCVSPDRLPDSTGKLPNEYDDLCSSISVEVSIVPEEISTEPEPTIDYAPPAPATADILPTLPLVEDFSSPDLTLRVLSGRFSIVPDSLPAIFGGQSWRTGQHGTALAVFRDIAQADNWSSVYRRLTAHFVLTNRSMRRNGGLIVNLRHKPSQSAVQDYWMVHLDQSGDFTRRKALRVSRFDGSKFVHYDTRPITQLSTGVQYRLSVCVLPAGNDAAWLLADVISALDETDPLYVNEKLGPVYLPDYGPPTGQFGIFAFDSETEFNRVRLDNEKP